MKELFNHFIENYSYLEGKFVNQFNIALNMESIINLIWSKIIPIDHSDFLKL